MYRLVIDGKSIKTKDDLYASVSQQLPLPSWFGKNLDALYDVLTCDILPKNDVDAEITDAFSLKENLGKYADSLIGMLSDIADEDKRLCLKIAE